MKINPPDPGHVIFFDHCVPPLRAGTYDLILDHVVDRGEVGSMGDPTQRRFEVVGPRFNLNPGAIHSVYPPPNASGAFEGRLPQIVLRRRTLPWERRVDDIEPPDGEAPPPWLALLLFEEDEVELLDPPNCTVNTILNKENESNIISPSLSVTAAEREKQCLGIQVPRNIFRDVAPQRDELRYLTHARQVNTEDKELLGMDKDGWFAVVVGNRLPEPGKKHIACLVSLEGHADNLPTAEDVEGFDAPAADPPAAIAFDQQIVASVHPSWYGKHIFENDAIVLAPQPKIRLVTLARWSFTCEDFGGDFEYLMKNITNEGGVALLGMTKKDATESGIEVTEAYEVALDSGHVPLNHLTRDGERTLAWYRGPLVPVGVERDTENGPYHSSDQARRIDPLTGFENLGYAAAFEIGRLMALADPRFAVELLRWRRSGNRRIVKGVFGSILSDRLSNLIEGIELDKYRFPFELTDKLVNDIYDQVQNDILGPASDPTGLLGIGGDLAPGINPDVGFQIGDGQVVRFGDMIAQAAALEGGAAVLDQLNIGAGLNLTDSFDELIDDAGLETLDHLNQVRKDMLDNMRGGGV